MDTPVVYAILLLSTILLYTQRNRKLDHIPALGPTTRILALLTWLKFLYKSPDIVKKGCEKFPSSIFRIPKFNGWAVVVHTPKLVEDLRKAPEDVLSFSDAVSEFLQMKHTLGSHIVENPSHLPIIRNHFTRGLPELFPRFHDEMIKAFQDTVPTEGGALPVLDTVKNILCRSSNRLFVGSSLCRDPDFLKLNMEFTITLAKASHILFLLPTSLRPLVARLLSSVRASVGRAQAFLDPVIEDRKLRSSQECVTPDDFLGWLIHDSKGDEMQSQNLSSRVLMINTASIHTTSMAMTHAIFYLAAYPEHVACLRKNVEQAISQEGGWTYTAILKMSKVDSFIRETQRLNALSCLQMDRIARKPFTFSDGTVVPEGTHLQVASCAAHFDPSSYGPDPTLFDPFRNINRAEDGRKLDMTSTHADFVAFGHGRHACPGRFFAAMMLKTMFAHVLMSYDVKLIGQEKPPNLWIANNCIPNPKAKVIFCPRESEVPIPVYR